MVKKANEKPIGWQVTESFFTIMEIVEDVLVEVINDEKIMTDRTFDLNKKKHQHFIEAFGSIWEDLETLKSSMDNIYENKANLGTFLMREKIVHKCIYPFQQNLEFWLVTHIDREKKKEAAFYKKMQKIGKNKIRFY